MAETKLTGCKVAILSEEGFEQSELLQPKEALQKAGAEVFVVSPRSGSIKAWNKTNWGETVPVDLTLEEADGQEFDALMLPGGVMNPDKLRMNEQAVEFVRKFVDSGKPIAAICHGPQTLIEAGAVEGRTMTSWPSLKTDLINAGANWVDREVVVDDGLITSRKPDDIPAFNTKMIEEFAEGEHNVRDYSQGRKTQEKESVTQAP
jgi:protease I